MERKRAWVTAATIGTTFAAAALAVMANTGLLHMGRAESEVGRLTPADLVAATTPTEMTPTETTPTETTLTPVPSTTARPRVIIRYEDVYVTAAGEPVSASASTVPSGPAVPVSAPTVPEVDPVVAPASTTVVAPKPKKPRRRSTAKAVARPSTKVTHETSHDDGDDETHEGDDDDD